MGQKTTDIGGAKATTMSNNASLKQNAVPSPENSRRINVSGADNDDDNEIEIQRRAIEDTRNEMTQTVDAIGHRLDPARLMEQAKDKVVETTSEIHDKIDPEHLLEKAKATILETTHEAPEMIHHATIGRMQTAVGSAMHRGREAVASVTDSAKAAPQTIVERIIARPLAASLTGLGLYLLFTGKMPFQRPLMTASSHDRLVGSGSDNLHQMSAVTLSASSAEPVSGLSTLNDRMGEMASHATDAVVGAARQVKTRVSDAGSYVKEAVSDAASNVKDTVSSAASHVVDAASQAHSAASDVVSQRLPDMFDRGMQRIGMATDRLATHADMALSQARSLVTTRPLSLGLTVVAFGAICGLLIPESEREMMLMGEAKTNLVDMAKSKVADVAEHIQESASDMMAKLTDESKPAEQPPSPQQASRTLHLPISEDDNAARRRLTLITDREGYVGPPAPPPTPGGLIQNP